MILRSYQVDFYLLFLWNSYEASGSEQFDTSSSVAAIFDVSYIADGLQCAVGIIIIVPINTYIKAIHCVL